MEKLHQIDLLLIVAYFGYLIWIALKFATRRSTSAEDYLLAGRSLGLSTFVATMVTTWYGGILGVGEFSYLYGVSNWLVFGIPYYLYALIFALFLARRARRISLYTIPDKLFKEYGQAAGLIGAVLVFITTVPAGYVLMLGVLLQILFGWPLKVSILIGAFFSVFYVLFGGFRSVVKTDFTQFGLMFGGFILILVIAVTKFGGWGFLHANLPATHFVWHGGNTPSYIFVWYFLAMSTLVEPSFYQRCYSAKTENIARYGIFIAIGCWIFFDFMSTSTGLYARAVLPDLDNAVQAYPMLALEVLPPVIKGIFFLALLATIMSTIDSYSFISAMTIGRDVIWRIQGAADESRLNFYTQIGLIATAILTIVMALWFESVIDVWHDIGSVGTPALLIPLASSFSTRWKFRPRLAWMAMLGAGVISLLFLLPSYFPVNAPTGAYLFGIEPIFPGLMVSIAFYCFDHLTRWRRPG